MAERGKKFRSRGKKKYMTRAQIREAALKRAQAGQSGSSRTQTATEVMAPQR